MKKTLPKRIPKYLHRFFWDVDVKKLNPQKYPYFVINRLLEKGNIEAVRFVLKNFPKEKIIETFKKIRDFNKKTAYFWSLFLKIPQRKIKCLEPSYLKMRMMHWPY
jgi:hypothetical protein